MSDNEAASIPPQTFVECGRCGGNANITWFCKNCPTSLCDDCATAHKTNHQYKSHAVVPRTYTVLRLYGPAKLAEQCHIHLEKEILSYCNECDMPCCISCLANNHNGHNFSTIEDKYLDAEKGLNEYYRHLDTDVRPTLEKMEEQARADVREDDMNVEKVIDEINDFRTNVVQNFNRACDDLIVQVKKISCVNTKSLRQIENLMQNLESIKNEIQAKIAKGNFDIIKYRPPDSETLIPKLDKAKAVVPVFKPSSKVLCVIKESVGIIDFKKISQRDRNKRNITVNVEKINTFSSKIGATSLTTAGNNMAWLVFLFSPTMYLYNDKGKVVRFVTMKGIEGINDMSITQSGEMIVTCNDKKVRHVSVSGEVSTMIDTDPFDCKGVCLTDKEKIVVCLTGNAEMNHVVVFSPDGRSQLREIRERDGQGNQLIVTPVCVARNGQDLCVVNVRNNVVCIDKRDNVRWIYDGNQAKLGESFSPRCICVDKYHNTLVSDGNNHCVHYIDREGGLIKVILTKEETEFTSHWGICVDNITGHVWVGNGSHGNVFIAKYLA